MHTYVDFLTRVKGIEYLISVATITGFILFVEFLKPKPFNSLAKAAGDDIDHIRRTGRQETLQTLKRLAAAPFIGALYVVSLPVICVMAVGAELMGMAMVGLQKTLGLAGDTAFFGWRPGESYLAGRRERKARKDARKADTASQEKGGTE